MPYRSKMLSNICFSIVIDFSPLQNIHDRNRPYQQSPLYVFYLCTSYLFICPYSFPPVLPLYSWTASFSLSLCILNNGQPLFVWIFINYLYMYNTVCWWDSTIESVDVCYTLACCVVFKTTYSLIIITSSSHSYYYVLLIVVVVAADLLMGPLSCGIEG